MTVWAIPQAPSGDSCVQPRIPLQTVDVDSTSAYKWMISRNPTGAVDAGVPYGDYTLCFKDGTSTNARYWTSPVYHNTAPPTGIQTLTKYSPTSGAWTPTAC